MTNLDRILKSRDTTLPAKVHLVKAMIFPVVMYGCESWAIKAQKNWCFWTVMLEKTLESPLDCKEIQPVHPKEDQSLGVHWKDWCWSWNSNTLATWWEEMTHLKRPWCWERLRAGGEGGNRGWDGWMASPTGWTWVWVDSGSWWWTGSLVCCDSWGCKESDTTEWLNWTGSWKALPSDTWDACLVPAASVGRRGC